ncbi:MAG: 10 kDa chaperonin [Candidatus Anoxychlamydiales bacterium]|nr:10 kDa chaperonin [Candidatus Anoxychlamydiales bacterium]
MTKLSEKKKTTLKPLADRVVAQRLESDETVKGGIIIPDSAKKKQEMARVIAIGEGKVTENKTLPMPVKVGDVILMDKYAGQEINIDDEEYIIVKADDIIALVEE